MESIVAILRAAHCKSTHHFFAIDSLWEVRTSRGEQLSDLLLAHYEDYLQGAKDPDNVFKDFENHVIHVSDGYWGGATKAAKKWLDKSYLLVNSGRWKEAAYAIGVLSHYFSDPFMPLHTAQSPRETAIHRPLEWSVCCSYRDIYQLACNSTSFTEFQLPTGSDWVTDSIYQGATFANQFYELLLDDYDMNESRRFPKLALGMDSKQALGQLFLSVVTAWGAALDRIANETTITFPKFPLSLPTVLAGLQAPNKKIIAAIENTEQRKEVEKILEEYQRTGQVVKNASLEQRKVSAVRRDRPGLVPPPEKLEEIRAISNSLKPSDDKLTPLPLFAQEDSKPMQKVKKLFEPPPVPLPTIPESSIKFADPKHEDAPTVPKVTHLSEPAGSRESRLNWSSPIVDAPAIGPKTATRFHIIGCNTIGDLVSGDAEQLAIQLKTSWITPRLLVDWQDQAQLACDIEKLTAAGAGLLVLANIRSSEILAEQDASELTSQIHIAAQSHAGKRLLRDQAPPSIQTVERWISIAKAVQAQSPIEGRSAFNGISLANGPLKKSA